MEATPGEGEWRERFTLRVLLVFHPAGVTIKVADQDGRLARYPLSRETSRRCCPCEAPCRAQLMLPVVAIKDAGAVYLYKPMNINNFLQ